MRAASRASDPVERAWVFEAGQTVSLGLAKDLEGLVALSFESLAPVRREFLRRLNLIKKNLRSADQTYDELRRLNLGRLLGPSLGRQPRLAGFIRDLFLSGNGSMLFSNSFVEWGAAEAMRRAQPPRGEHPADDGRRHAGHRSGCPGAIAANGEHGRRREPESPGHERTAAGGPAEVLVSGPAVARGAACRAFG